MDDLDCTPEKKLKGDGSVVEYEAEFLRLSPYAQGMVASEYERCVRPKKKARSNGLVTVGPPVSSVTPTGLQSCSDYGRRHLGECWRRIEACLRCGSLEHCIRECPLRVDQVQALTLGPAQLQRVVQQPLRGRG
ncbi:pre-mrna-splicing factor slu7 [Gossypium australe]|uniref:Pre-mrna-splicing factor slu7 n=1 Tax=Gossypium australe TaxID=47621 RepID=A0A5B6X3E8_9ROSI|nr:pre-mrna-splicing factor slu7 [Gossypium australe]